MTDTTYTIRQPLVTTACCNCHIVFGMTQALYNDRLDDGGTFYCPNGHGQVFTEPRVPALEREAKRLRARLVHAEDQRIAAEREAVDAKKAATVAKGQATKLRKRVAAGVCPCCHRSFQELARHMATQHPDYPEGNHDDRG